MIDLINPIKDMVFNFVFEGHQYIASDSSRNPNTCPHCGYFNVSGRIFRENSPGVTFLGTKDFGDHMAKCFECNSCFQKFYYHIS